MNRERLEHLITVLKSVPKQNFHMGFWGVSEYGNDCGTTCCAFGYAALDPEFQEQGLKMVHTKLTRNLDQSWNRDTTVLDSIVSFNALARKLDEPIEVDIYLHNGKTGYEAAKEFFDLEENTVYFLFSPDYYKSFTSSPDEVIERIQTVLDKGEGNYLAEPFNR